MSVLSFLAGFVYSQLVTSLPYPQKDFSGHTIIVTGSNVGLGLEAARHFTRLNAERVILGVRNLEKGEAAKNSIEESTNRKGAVEFAKRAEGLKRLDAVVENAGISKHVWTTAEDNEATITTNVVSTFLLALALLPKLRETASKFNVTPHLAVVSSEVHYFSQMPERHSPSIFEKLNEKETENMNDRYNVSKLLEVFYCRELAAHITQSDKPSVILNFVDPGLCHSELAREGPIVLAVLKFLLARTTEQGSRTLVHAAEAGEESHGQYLSDCKVNEVAPLVSGKEGPAIQERVWEELNQRLERIQPGVTQNV